MAWTATDNFESYANGASIGGGSGGSGWNGNYQAGGAWTATNAQKYEGTQSVTSTGANANMLRPVTAISSGVFYFAMMRPDTTADASFRMQGSGSGYADVTFEASNITLSGGVPTRLLTGYVTSNWYLFEITLIDTSHLSVRFHDGVSWSTSTGSLASQNSVSVDHAGFNQGGGGTAYWDYISPINPIGGGGGSTASSQAGFLSLLGVGN